MLETLANDVYLNAFILVILGGIAFLYGFERFLDAIPGLSRLTDTEDKGTMLLKWFTLALSIFSTVWSVVLIFTGATYSWLTLILLFIFSFIVLSHPLRDVEGWMGFLILLPILIISIVALWFAGDRQISFFGATIPLWIILSLVTTIFIIIFLVLFFVEEAFIDPLLGIIGWAPVVIVVCIILIIHGLAMAFVNDVSGLAELFRDIISDDVSTTAILRRFF